MRYILDAFGNNLRHLKLLRIEMTLMAPQASLRQGACVARCGFRCLNRKRCSGLEDFKVALATELALNIPYHAGNGLVVARSHLGFEERLVVVE